MTIQEFLSLLSGDRPSGKGYKALCPAHEDRQASLSVADGADGRVLLNCFGGCTNEQVVSALGLRLSDLMPDSPPRSKRVPGREIVATYDYRDEQGLVLFQVVRYHPKDFRQRKPDGTGGWNWELKTTRRVLYRLPELRASETDHLVFLCEGEKDVDRLVTLGFVGTTAPGGAGKWQPDFSEALRGRRVVVLPDNDDAGRRHAKTLARALHGVAARVSVLELERLPLKGDVSNWLDAGHTPDELARLAQDAPEWSPSSVSDLAAMLDALEDLIRRFVIMTESQAVVWALWVAHTHAIDAAEQTPYLSITSAEKRSGKTRVLEVSEQVVARPWLTGRVSAAALVRKVDKERPTLLLDESDAAFNGEKDYAEALRGLLNTGHRANGRSSFCVGVGPSLDVRDFSTFCPKAIAGIGKNLPDTVADRAIPIRLQRKSRSEGVSRFRERLVRVETSDLRERLKAWGLASETSLRGAEPPLPDELSDRAQDGAEPLLAIADLAGDEWPQRARRALVELCTGDNPEDDSLGVRLLRDCRTIFGERCADRLFSSDLCAALVEMQESPWGEFQKGRPLTVRSLGRLLNAYGIVSGTIRLDEVTKRGYYRIGFEDAWSRYAPPMGSQIRKRPYRLSPTGLRSLRASIRRVKPWRRATGPRTAEGKAKAKMNAFRHGERSAEAAAVRREIAALARALRNA